MSSSWSVIDEETYATYGQTYTYVDETAVSGQSYEYRVKAVGHGTAIDSGYSNTIVAGSGASQLSAPTLTGEQQYYGIRIDWTVVSNADQYMIGYKLHSSEEWLYTPWVSITDQAGCYTELEVTNSEVWDFKVTAGKSDSSYIASEWSNTVTVTAPANSKVHKLEITSASYYKNLQNGPGAKVYWKYGSGCDYVIIERKLSTSSTWSQVGVQNNNLNYFDDEYTATNGQTWNYRLKAHRDGWIDSDYSDVYDFVVNLKLSTPTIYSLEAYDFDTHGEDDRWSPYEAALALIWTDADYRADYINIAYQVGSGSWHGPYSVGKDSGGYKFTSSDILLGGTVTVMIAALDSSGFYTASDWSTSQSVTFKERTYFHSNAAYLDGKAIDPSGLTGGWKNGRDSDSGTLSYSTDSNGVMSVSAGSSTYGYRITSNPINLTGYSRLCMYGYLTKPSRDAQSRFGTCKYTGDNTGVGCWSSNYASLGTYASGTMKNPSLTSFTKTNDTHVMLFASQSGAMTVGRIFAIKS